ncbi:MAG: MBL fold metallo-hydrolase [Planctomycetes bacterium]|nr:MBL fold metallo-hydrolase [Planctomycetota bacterium]
MQIRYLGHAAILVTAPRSGTTILMDPWLEDPAYCNSWFHYPPLVDRIADLAPVDYVYCSHEHPDHFDPPTLRQLPGDQRILLPEFSSGTLRERFERIGMSNFVPMPFGEPLDLAPDLRVTCLRSDLVWEDSAIVVESDGTTLFNMNDCKLGDELLAAAGERFRPDIVFVPFSGAIHFPTCYDYSPEQRARLCAARQRKHLDAFVHRIRLLGAPRAVPFAGNFVLLAPEQLWMNAKDTNNINTPDDAIARLAELAPEVEGVQMNPGDTWTRAGGLVRRAPAPDFRRKLEHVRELAEREAGRIAALRAAEPPARASLGDDVRRYFAAIAARHPELCGRIAARIEFEAEGLHGGRWLLDYSDRGLSITDQPTDQPTNQPTDQPWNLRITLPASILQRAVDGEICWDEVAISFRCRFAENPEGFNQDFWAMLYNPSEAFLSEYLANPEPKFA